MRYVRLNILRYNYLSCHALIDMKINKTVVFMVKMFSASTAPHASYSVLGVA